MASRIIHSKGGLLVLVLVLAAAASVYWLAMGSSPGASVTSSLTRGVDSLGKTPVEAADLDSKVKAAVKAADLDSKVNAAVEAAIRDLKGKVAVKEASLDSKVKAALQDPRGKVVRRTNEGWVEEDKVCQSKETFQTATLKSEAGDIPIFIHDQRDGISRYLANSGKWEPTLAPVLMSCFGNDKDLVFLDIGANIGVFSLPLAKTGRQVISVEPRWDNAARLCRSVQHSGLDKNWTLVYNAISDQRETMEVKKGAIPGRTYVMNAAKSGTADEATFSIYLDDLLEIFPHLSKAVVKIDIERHEARALANARKFFKQVEVPCLMMEFERHNRSPDGYRIMLEMAKYGFLAYDPKNLKESLDASKFGQWPANIIWRQIREYGPETQ